MRDSGEDGRYGTGHHCTEYSSGTREPYENIIAALGVERNNATSVQIVTD
jgi:hypothetical protein